MFKEIVKNYKFIFYLIKGESKATNGKDKKDDLDFQVTETSNYVRPI